MPETPQITYRLIVTRSGAEVLLRRAGSGWTLPEIRISGNSRPAASITEAIKRELGLTALCLGNDGLNVPGHGVSHEVPAFYQVMEARDPDWEAPPELSWYDSKIAEDFLLGDQAMTIDSALKGLVLGGPFGRLGWLDCLRSKLASHIGPRKFTDKFDQLNISEHFSLVRLETTGSAVWFKATGHPNAHERAVTLWLAREFPWALPQIVADVPEWNGWAMEETGSSLHDFIDLDHWKMAVEAMAEIQVACVGKSAELLRLGALDQRFQTLLARVDGFFAAMEELMALQPKTPPAVLTRQELRDTADALKEACDHLAGLGVPDTLLHGDISPGSVLVSGESCVIADWCEAYIGFPFLTFEHMLAHLQSRRPGSENWCDPLRDAYRNVWSSVLSRSQMDHAFAAVPLVAAYAHVIPRDRWSDLEHRNRPEVAKYYRSLTRRMWREVQAVQLERIA